MMSTRCRFLPPGILRWRRAAFSAAAMCVAANAVAQAHVHSAEGLTLRASIASSLDLAPSSARRHGIERSAAHGVLNVTLMAGEGQAGPTVPAEVQVHIQGLYGLPIQIELHPVRAQGRVSYFGSFRHQPREVIDVDISARPCGGGPRLSLSFRERMGAPDGR